jgi:hypothetical protein
MLYIVLVLIALLLIWAVLIFNTLVGLRQMAQNGWSDIEV